MYLSTSYRLSVQTVETISRISILNQKRQANRYGRHFMLVRTEQNFIPIKEINDQFHFHNHYPWIFLESMPQTASAWSVTIWNAAQLIQFKPMPWPT
jgi:hypothetical protein